MVSSTAWTLSIVWSNYAVDNFIDVIKLHLIVDTVLTDDLDVVFLSVFA